MIVPGFSDAAGSWYVSVVRSSDMAVLIIAGERQKGKRKELRDTTLNMLNRTLIHVTMDDAAADDLFRILMGDKVEPRREFIEKHTLEVKNLDV